jgi:hypothetical protein
LASNGHPYGTDAELTSTLGDIGVHLDGPVHIQMFSRQENGAAEWAKAERSR